MRSILLINVFFGKFPWYFNLFLKSCKTNPTIDFTIFTDNENNIKLPPNVKLIKFSLNQFSRLASEKLGFEIKVLKPYKLCDFKPAYGIIFSDYLKNHEYWGMTDIDLIFGRIREFVTDELLENFDVVSVRNDYPTGSFMIFKNNEYFNNLFKKSKDYKNIFMSHKHFCFDECNFEHVYLENGGDIFEIETEIDSMHHILSREMQENGLKVHFDFLIIEGLPGKLYWNNGFLSYKNEYEVLFYHLILYKDNEFSLKRKMNNLPNQFYIDKYLIRGKGIYSKLNYIINEQLRVFTLMNILKIDYFISQKISRNKVNTLNSGVYENGKHKRFISVDKKNNLFSFYLGQEPMCLFNSILSKDRYFLKGMSYLFYQLSSDKKVLEEISLDGSTFKLEKI